jgi:hypothetical protein
LVLPARFCIPGLSSESLNSELQPGRSSDLLPLQQPSRSFLLYQNSGNAGLKKI